ncbi:MAG: segregation and condensation protein A, partial [Rhodothermales bacterium]
MYRVHLQEFEGPLDLLLFFIRRDELDIYDIPIAHIADEFLEYVRLIEEIDLDGVADFIYVAALLISIKVRMLLPRPEL